MTIKQVLENVIIDLHKEEAPTLLITDYIYFLNKAIYQKCNSDYNLYEMNQQLTDSLRVLKANSIIDLTKTTKYRKKIYGNVYECNLPSDYFHILNCIVGYSTSIDGRCDTSTEISSKADKALSDNSASITTNYYMRPSYRKPYFYIQNINYQNQTNPDTDKLLPDYNGLYPGDSGYSELEASKRYGNVSPVRLEIRVGKDDKYIPSYVAVDYLKTPQYVTITQDQIDSTIDSSQTLEFPDYICYEIINMTVKLILENSSDNRINTYVPVNQSIMPPINLNNNK